MGLFSKINPMKIISGVGNFVDESFLSKEEVQKAITEHYKNTLTESTPRSLTRRYIAVSIIAVFLLLIIASGSVFAFNEKYSLFLFDIIKEIFGIVLTIIIFYFGGYYGDKLIKRKDKKTTN